MAIKSNGSLKFRHNFNMNLAGLKRNNFRKIISAVSIIFLGVILRIFLNDKIGVPNFESVTTLSLVSGSFLGGIYGISVSLAIVFFSDLYFGNTYIYLFTWSAFILIGAFGALIKKNSGYYFLKMVGSGILSVLFFYLYTNLGWWLTSRMYPGTAFGILQCYIAGLPFLKNQLISVIVFMPTFLFLYSSVLGGLKTGYKYFKELNGTRGELHN